MSVPYREGWARLKAGNGQYSTESEADGAVYILAPTVGITL